MEYNNRRQILMKCNGCGNDLSDDVMFCGKCGKPTSSGSNKIKCKKCDREMDSNLEYCPRCGTSTYSRGYNKRRNRDDDDDDEDEGIFGGIGDFIGKIFRG
jgi:rRNA maturation endonuclease Nob1